jgi:hypothetical protein
MQIFRRPSDARGSSPVQAVAESGNEYEHGETDEQIIAIEGIMAQVREESGASAENRGRDEQGLSLRGATFDWRPETPDGEDGDIILTTSYVEDADDPTSVADGVEGKQWVSETWVIDPNGKVTS